jgi:hypothetical protein
MANEFSMDGLLGTMFGSADSELEKLLTAKQKEQLGLQSTLAAAAALLQAGGRSPQRIGLGQALGSALQAGQGAYEKGTTGAINQMMLGEKLKEMQRLNQYQRALVGGGAEGTPTPAMQALAAPGLQAGPTVDRAAIMDQIKPMSADDKRFEDYMRKADIATQYGRIEDADKYLNMAYKIKPQAEVVGQPFEVTDAAGKPLMVQQFKSGKIQTLEGFGPKREIVLQNLNNRVIAVDKSKLTGKESFAMGMSPSEAANLGIANKRLALDQATFNRGAYDIKETPEGFAYVPKMPGGEAMPVMGAAGQLQPAKEAPQAFSEATRKLNNLKGNISAYKTEVQSDKVVFPSEVPLPFGAKIPLPTGEDTARMRGKYQSLLMGVKDLYELGALTGPDMGIISEQLTNPASFSGVFTSRNAMKEQIKVLEDMAARAEENLSATYKRKLPGASQAGIQAAPAAPAAAAQPMMSGVPTWDPVKKQYVYQ